MSEPMFDARKILDAAVHELDNGGGGGRVDMAQGGGKATDEQMDAAIKSAVELIAARAAELGIDVPKIMVVQGK